MAKELVPLAEKIIWPRYLMVVAVGEVARSFLRQIVTSQASTTSEELISKVIMASKGRVSRGTDRTAQISPTQYQSEQKFSRSLIASASK